MATVPLPAVVKPPEPPIAPLKSMTPVSAWIVLAPAPFKEIPRENVPELLKSSVALLIVTEPLAARLPPPAALSVPAVIEVLPL